VLNLKVKVIIARERLPILFASKLSFTAMAWGRPTKHRQHKMIPVKNIF